MKYESNDGWLIHGPREEYPDTLHFTVWINIIFLQINCLASQPFAQISYINGVMCNRHSTCIDM